MHVFGTNKGLCVNKHRMQSYVSAPINVVIHNMICHGADIIWFRGKKAIIGGSLVHDTANAGHACLLIIKNPQFKTLYITH